MCGLAGFIGNSTDQEQSFRVVTELFLKNQSRGLDACGYWGRQGDKILYHKQAGPAADLASTSLWTRLKRYSLDLLLTHTRAGTGGSPNNRRNNHPFVSRDGRTALVHNGRLTFEEYHSLMGDVRGDCDSEALLEPTSRGLDGILEIFSTVREGSMAVAAYACGSAWLFRNSGRPLCVAEAYGQYFFFSDAAAWECGGVVTALRPGEIWEFSPDGVARHSV